MTPKTDPTDLDREAARLFVASPGMRVILSDRLYGGMWARVSVATPGMLSGCYERGSATWDACGSLRRLDAIDMDDPAAQGACLAQLSFAAGAVVAVWEFAGGFHAIVQPNPDALCDGSWCRLVGPGNFAEGCKSIGAAMVAAMRGVS